MKLKSGVEIQYKKKKYSGEIPDPIFDEIFGSGNDKAKDKFEAKSKKPVKKVEKIEKVEKVEK